MEEAGHRALIAQVATEKQTIVHMVSAGLGLAVVPRWTSRMKVDGVTYRPLLHRVANATPRLPLAVAWIKNSRDALRDALLETLFDNLGRYGTDA